MDICAVPSCKLKSEIKFSSPRNETQLNLWRKILKISEKKFFICDQHFEEQFVRTRKLGVTADAYPTMYLNNIKAGSSDICQCCMRSFVNQHFDEIENFYMIADDFQKIFRDVIGCPLPIGLVCKKCYNYIREFQKFREKIRKLQSTRKEVLLENSQKSNDTELPPGYTIIANEEDEETDTQFEVVEYDDDEFHVEIKEEQLDEQLEVVSEIEIKEEPIEDQTSNEVLKTPKRRRTCSETDSEKTNSPNLTCLEDLDESFVIKVESDDELLVEAEPETCRNNSKPTSSLQISEVSSYIPKISNSVSKSAPKIIQDPRKKLRLTQISSPHPPKCSKRIQENTKPMSIKIKCQYCSAKFENREDHIFDHIQKMHSFPCPSCNVVLPFKSSLDQHQASHHREKKTEQTNTNSSLFIYGCPVCPKRFSSCDILKIHTKKHNVDVNIVDSSSEDESKDSKELSNRILKNFKPAKPRSEPSTS